MFYKMVPYDASSRVPLVIAAPFLTGQRSIAQPVQLLDIFPTLAALAGVAPAPPYLQGHDLGPFLRGAAADPSRPPYVLIQNADEDQSMAWFAVVNGSHKLVQYGTGREVPPQLFDLGAEGGSEATNLAPSQPQAVAALDAALRSLIDYPAVALDIAAYQKQQLNFWRNATPDWRAVAASEAIRWHPAWSAAPEAALAALEAYLDDPSVALLPCSGALARG
jgi:choline-sulfatase